MNVAPSGPRATACPSVAVIDTRGGSSSISVAATVAPARPSASIMNVALPWAASTSPSALITTGCGWCQSAAVIVMVRTSMFRSSSPPSAFESLTTTSAAGAVPNCTLNVPVPVSATFSVGRSTTTAWRVAAMVTPPSPSPGE